MPVLGLARGAIVVNVECANISPVRAGFYGLGAATHDLRRYHVDQLDTSAFQALCELGDLIDELAGGRRASATW